MTKQIKTALPTKVTGTGMMIPSTDDAGLANYIRTIQQFPILTAEQEYEYASQWVKNHDQGAA